MPLIHCIMSINEVQNKARNLLSLCMSRALSTIHTAEGGRHKQLQIKSSNDLKVELIQSMKMPTFVSTQMQYKRCYYLWQILVLFLVNVIKVQ